MRPQHGVHRSDAPVRHDAQSSAASAVSTNSPTLATSGGTRTDDPTNLDAHTAAAHAAWDSPR